VDGSQVGVLEQTYQVGFGGFLQGEHGGGLESQVGLVLGCDFSNESLEGEFSNEEFSTLLEFSDFSECNCAWSESVNLLDTTSLDGSLLGLFGSNVLSWGLATSVLSCSLFCSCHCIWRDFLNELYLKFESPYLFNHLTRISTSIGSL
jgi:hypothetical protein